MIRALRHTLNEQNYRPTRLGVFVNPHFFVRRALCEFMKSVGAKLRGRVLDVGCGTMPYRAYIPADQYVGVEVLHPNKSLRPTVYFDGLDLPFKDAAFDALVCNQVLEHTREPRHALTECARVLREGGVLVLTMPFLWEEHEQPWDFQRYTQMGLRRQLTSAGFTVETLQTTMPDIRALAQLYSSYVFGVARRHGRGLAAMAQVLCIAPVNILAMLLYRVLPRNENFYLDLLVVARRTPSS